MTSLPSSTVDAAWLLPERAEAVRVRRVGKVAKREQRPYGVVVLGPDGREISWLSKVYEFMGGGGYSLRTYLDYAEGFLRVARCAWALGLEMESLRPAEYAVLRAVLRDPRRNLYGREYAPRTLKLSEDALLTIYDTAERYGIISQPNPVRTVVDGPPLPAGRSSQRQWTRRMGRRKSRIAEVHFQVGPVLTPEERATLKAATDPLTAALFQVLDEAGLRVSEALSITLDSLSPQDHKIQVRSKSRGGIGLRWIPATDTTFARIREYDDYLDRAGIHLGPHDPLFRNKSDLEKPLSRFGVYHLLQKTVPGASGQKTRRTTATRLLATLSGPSDARILRVRDILGHASITTTEMYLRHEEQQLYADLLEAVERDVPVLRPQTSPIFDYDVRARVEAWKETA